MSSRDSEHLTSKASSLSIAGTVRGFIVAYGIGAYALIQHLVAGARREIIPFGENPLNLILIGFGLQAVRWVVLRAVGRYEKTHELEGALAPTVMVGIDLIIDGVTVLLFALATFRSITDVATSV
jgi:hypothetical protein